MTVGYRYAALGDSTGVGVGAHDGRGYVVRLFDRIRARVPEAELFNACVSGATSRDVAGTQLARALARHADLATVFVGTNDLWWAGTAGFGEHLERIATALARSATHAVLCTIPNLTHAPAAALLSPSQRVRLDERLAAWNARVRSCASEHGIAVVDLFAYGLADRPHFFSEDGFHPSAEGYEELAERLYERIAPWLPHTGSPSRV